MDPSENLGKSVVPPPISPPRVRRARKVVIALFILAVLFPALAFGYASLVGRWFLWTTRSSEGHLSLVFLEAIEDGVVAVPSEAEAYGVVLGFHPPFLSVAHFSLGWREILGDAIIESRPELPGGLLTLTMRPVRADGVSEKEYYSICGGRLALVRLQDSEGTPTPNVYYASNLMIGPQVPNRTAEEWEQAILSDNQAEILRTLVWLGGCHHGLSSQSVPNQVYEDFWESAIGQREHRKAALQRRIGELRRSTNGWIQQAAEAAASPH
jgi:hypothetical protein